MKSENENYSFQKYMKCAYLIHLVITIPIHSKLIGILLGNRILEDAREITGTLKDTLKVPNIARQQASGLRTMPNYGLPDTKR